VWLEECQQLLEQRSWQGACRVAALVHPNKPCAVVPGEGWV
jgi:hypothetical protein